jgi:hypothetical protein
MSDIDLAKEMRKAAEAMLSHANCLRGEGDWDQAEAVETIACGNLRIAQAIEAKDRRIAELEAEVAKARAFAEEAARRYNEMSADQRILRCAFCGAEYAPGTPPTQHEALTAHVKVCPQHPMREVERERDRRIAELEERSAKSTKLRGIDDWHEDHGCGLWWREPVSEPPYAGAPGDSEWPWPKKDAAKLVWIPCPNPSSDRRATEDVPGD